MDASRPLNPVEIERALYETTNRIAKGIIVVNKRFGEFQEADRHFDREFATAYLTAEGSIRDKEMTAKLESMPAREERDLAEQKHRHAVQLLKALDQELKTLQSIGASVRESYRVAGRGES